MKKTDFPSLEDFGSLRSREQFPLRLILQMTPWLGTPILKVVTGIMAASVAVVQQTRWWSFCDQCHCLAEFPKHSPAITGSDFADALLE